MIQGYWGKERVYHPQPYKHDLRQEALLMVVEEGLEQRFARHIQNSTAFIRGIEAMGLSMIAPEGYRLPTLNAVRIPEGVEDIGVRKHLLHKYGIEIGGGLGEFKGKAWRIGLMGESSRRNNVLLLLASLADSMGQQGHKVDVGAGIQAALEVYNC